MKKILITSTDVMMFQFLIPHIENFLENGYEVEIACSEVEGHLDEVRTLIGEKVKIHTLALARSPFKLKNAKGYSQLKELIKRGGFNLIWTNEPVMGVLTRLAAKKVKKHNRPKIIYFAHGFHFFKGCSISRWLFYYPVEKSLARLCDLIITINEEDYILAKNKFKGQKIVKFPGVGINTSKFVSKGVDIEKKKASLDLPKNSTVFLSVGELEKRKNHKTTIRAFSKANIENAYLLICGVGSQEKELKKQIKALGMEQRILLLGYRYDVGELLETADYFVFTTFQEGLSVALMEAMSVGAKCVISKIRGNVDLVKDGDGITCDPKDVESCTKALLDAVSFDWESAIRRNKEYIKEFDIENVKSLMLEEVKLLIG